MMRGNEARTREQLAIRQAHGPERRRGAIGNWPFDRLMAPSAVEGQLPIQRRASSGGFALLIVMILLGVGVITSVTYLATASVKLNSANNLLSGNRARYAAESGVEHAKWLIETQSGTISDGRQNGPFYVETNPGDTYRFWVTGIQGQPGVFSVTAEGISGRSHQRASAHVNCSNMNLVTTKALSVDGDTEVPSCVDIVGDVHSDKKLTNYGHINGNVTYTSSIKGNTSSAYITGSKTKVSKITLPSLDWDDYSTYRISGVSYTSVSRTTTSLQSNDPLNNGGAVTATNPGGVVRLKGQWYFWSLVDAGINDNVNFTGTLVVEGDLYIEGSNIHLTAVSGFPALVVEGRIYMTGDARLTVDGMVFAQEGIASSWEDGDPDDARSTINGAIISNECGYDEDLEGDHSLNYVQQRCMLFNLTQTTANPATIVQWLD